MVGITAAVSTKPYISVFSGRILCRVYELEESAVPSGLGEVNVEVDGGSIKVARDLVVRDGDSDVRLRVDNDRLVGTIDAIGGDKNSTVLGLTVGAFGYDGGGEGINRSQ